jgi:hypothetical protein
MDAFVEPSRERPTTRRTREVRPGPRTRLTTWWAALDVVFVGAAVFEGRRRIVLGELPLGFALFGAAVALVALDAWRLAVLRRLRSLAAYGRIDRAAVTGVRTTRFSLAPRADGPAPTGGWPIIPACEVSYAFDGGDGLERRGRFLVDRAEAPQFPVGDDVEVFVDRDDPSRHASSLVVRWYYRLSSRHVGLSDDDPHLSFEIEPDPPRRD